MRAETLPSLSDFFKYQVEHRDIIVLDLPVETKVVSFKIEADKLRQFDRIVNLMKESANITRSRLLKKIVESIIGYCNPIEKCIESREIHLVIRF